MSINLRDELNKLSSTAPLLKDIEYSDDETSAKVVEKSNEYEDELDFKALDQGNKRIRAPIGDLSEFGLKYKGKPISRKEINASDIDEDFDSENENGEEEDDGDDDEIDQDDDEEEEGDDDDEIDQDDDEEEEDDDDDDDDVDDDDEEEMEESDEGKKKINQKYQHKKSKNQEPLKLSNYNQKEEMEKGKAVKNQLNFWDNLVEARVRLQNVLNVVNQFPQFDQFDQILENLSEEFKPINEAQLKQNQESLNKVMNQLIELQQKLVQRNPETNYILNDLKLESQKSEQNESHGGPDLKRKMINSEGSSDESENDENDDDDEEIYSDTDEEMRAEEIKQAKKEKKLKTFHFKYLGPDQFEDYLQKFNKSFLKYRDSTIQKWYDKTRLTTGKSFESLEKPILQQIEHILLDKERIIKRTQLKRGQYKICGKEEKIEDETDLVSLKNRHLKDYDSEIFDDQDFYNQLLRELVERKSNNISDPIELSRKSIELQKLRAKNKKKVDTKASKGRKIKFEIHKPLVNFMAPVYRTSMSEEARNELFRSLFGGNQREEKQNSKNNDIDISKLFKGF